MYLSIRDALPDEVGGAIAIDIATPRLPLPINHLFCEKSQNGGSNREDRLSPHRSHGEGSICSGKIMVGLHELDRRTIDAGQLA